MYIYIFGRVGYKPIVWARVVLERLVDDMRQSNQPDNKLSCIKLNNERWRLKLRVHSIRKSGFSFWNRFSTTHEIQETIFTPKTPSLFPSFPFFWEIQKRIWKKMPFYNWQKKTTDQENNFANPFLDLPIEHLRGGFGFRNWNSPSERINQSLNCLFFGFRVLCKLLNPDFAMERILSNPFMKDCRTSVL